MAVIVSSTGKKQFKIKIIEELFEIYNIIREVK